MNQKQPVVSIRDVSKVFDNGAASRTQALKDISLDIAPGSFVSLIGPSGCGKSTLLRLIGDLTTPSSGTVVVNGKSARQARLDRDYGIILQEPTLYEWRSIEKNVELPLEVMDRPRATRSSRAQEMLRLVHLEGFGHYYPWQLSGGMQQRVSIARALSFEPALLLMDEPFGALDEMTREIMQVQLLSVWTQTRTTVIFVTHSIPEAIFLSDQVIVMSPRPGRIAAIVDVALPRPRAAETRELPLFFEKVTEVRKHLRGMELSEASS